MPKLSPSIRKLVAQSNPRPFEELTPVDDVRNSYGGHQYRTATAMLTSGHIGAKRGGSPRMDDVKRMTKNTGADHYFVQRVGTLLVATQVLTVDEDAHYVAGPNYESFWEGDASIVQEIVRAGVVRNIDARAEYNPYRWGMTDSEMLIIVRLFFTAFRGKALRYTELAKTFAEFCHLPSDDLCAAGEKFGIDATDSAHVWGFSSNRHEYLKSLDQFFLADWIRVGKDKDGYWYTPSPLGLEMLGIEPLSPRPPLDTMLWPLSNHSIFAGSGLPIETLATLFATCKAKHIDQVIEFQLDPRRLQELPPGDVHSLRAVLVGVELPSVVRQLLETTPIQSDPARETGVTAPAQEIQVGERTSPIGTVVSAVSV